MNRLIVELHRVAEHLKTKEYGFALIGGLAVSTRAEPRFTRDIDLAICVDDDSQAEKLVRFLSHKGYSTLAVVEQDACGRLATVRLVPSFKDAVGVVVDLLFASSGIEQEIVEMAEEIEVVDGTRLPVARVGHLIALKLLSREDTSRPQDVADLRALLSHATQGEIELAREAVEIIEQRGFHRDRDLKASLRQLVGEEG